MFVTISILSLICFVISLYYIFRYFDKKNVVGLIMLVVDIIGISTVVYYLINYLW